MGTKRFLRKNAVYFIFINVILVIQRSTALQNDEAEVVCAKKCTCTEERISDVPMMKWQTIPMNRKFSNIQKDNDVLDKDEEDDAILEQNPIILAAFCIQQDDVINISHDEFAPALEALTLLYGPDAYNKTIVHELDEFQELIALDIQGYDYKKSSFYSDSELKLHYEALSELRNLRYVNIENIRLLPHLKVIHPNFNANRFNRSKASHRLNLIYLDPSDTEILPYEEYKKQKSIITTFNHLTDLQFLRLFRCHIDFITWEMFNGLDNLRTLSLQNNNITELPEYVFYSIPQLQSLILSQNKIKRIHSESLAGLFHLENLDLSHNQLKTLSDTSFAPLPRLHSLNLLGNPLENLASNTFETGNNSRVLWIGSTRSLITQEDVFSSLNQLEKLILLGIDAYKFHKGILRGLSNLRYFRMSGNVESLVFDTFTGSLLLEELILRHCSLKSVSVDAFYGLTQLKRLDLSRNKLQTLQPDIFDQLYSLKELNLARNQFTTLPRLVLANLQHVDMIRLEVNPWNCSCDMSEWGSLNLDKKKVIKMIEQPCTYQYDKIPCTSFRTDIYVQDSKATPRCVTPKEYEGWSVLRAVHANMECWNKEKNWPMKYPKSKKIGTNIILSTIELDEDNGRLSTMTSTEQSHNSHNEDNSLGDLSENRNFDNGLH